MNIKVYVEGGGKGNAIKTKCRRGFSKIFAKATPNGAPPSLVACGPREEALKRFIKAVESNSKQVSILLVDSEGPVPENKEAWDHLSELDNRLRKPQ